MKDDERQQFREAIQTMCAVYNVEPSLPLLTGYWLGMQDLELSDVQAAVGRALKQGGEFMPKPAALRELAGERTPAMRAIDAWVGVKRAIGSIGAYQTVEFDDPIATHVVRMLGGWVRLCSTESAELDKWTSQRFQRLYEDVVASGRTPEAEPLRGLHAIDAASKQFPEPKPVRIAIAPVELKQLPAAKDDDDDGGWR